MNHVYFLLDRSGSIAGHEHEVVDAYNAFIRQLKDEKVEVGCTLMLFNDTFSFLYNNLPLSEVRGMEVGEFTASSNTLLWDAISQIIAGQTVPVQTNVHLRRLGVPLPQAGRLSNERHMVVIVTDGQDTGSVRREDEIRTAVGLMEASGLWTFVWIAVGGGYFPGWAKNKERVNFKDFSATTKRLASAMAVALREDKPLALTEGK